MFTLFVGGVWAASCCECQCRSKFTSSNPVCPRKNETYYRVTMFGYACDIDNPCATCWYPFSVTKCVGQSANNFDNSICETETPDDPAVDYWTPPPMPTPIPPMTPYAPQTLPPMPTPIRPQTPLPPQTLPPMPTPIPPQTPQTLPPMPTPIIVVRTLSHKNRIKTIFAFSFLLFADKFE